MIEKSRKFSSKTSSVQMSNFLLSMSWYRENENFKFWNLFKRLICKINSAFIKYVLHNLLGNKPWSNQRLNFLDLYLLISLRKIMPSQNSHIESQFRNFWSPSNYFLRLKSITILKSYIFYWYLGIKNRFKSIYVYIGTKKKAFF